MEAARTGGKVIIVSRNTEVPDFNPVGHPFLGKKLELLTSYGYPHDGHRWNRNRSIALTLDLLSRGRLNIKPMITHRLNWDELPEAYRRLEEGDPEMVGTVLKWT
jgi:threonine dehydrogenase-like Zn-dependent dehydrogenase